MWKQILLWLCLSSFCLAGPLGPKRNMPIIQRHEEDLEKQSNENEASKPEANAAAPQNMLMISTLTLPSNATSIRADITDGFSCANKSYGYYADVENDCQIFHVCLPVTYADGRENTFRWSFICPEETIFSQDSFTCMRREDMTIDCEESFKYYELNRNFGVTEDEENKQPQSSSNISGGDIQQESAQDQETAMTSQVLEHEQHKQPIKQPLQQQQQQQQQQQSMSVVETEKLNSESTKPSQIAITQKEKPIKKQKPNRRKPSNNSNKKKPTTTPNRKIAQPVTVQPVIATTVESSSLIEETKPPRYTKRPALSVNLKEKFQPVRQSEPSPLRVDLYNQKRKRPSIFNKKDATTLRPAEQFAPITELIAAQESTQAVESEAETPKTESPDLVKTLSNLTDLVASEASETSAVVLKPNEVIETKKISQPQPTEPEAITSPELTTIQETPTLEAIEEIPAMITEVEETNSNQKTLDSSSTQNPSSETTHENSPAIFQQNSEESFSPVNLTPIEEMEQQKPESVADIISATPDMEHQDPMIEQMLSDKDTEANKQTMGGFKPVDPAMAAEAEALIANFLNTLMKSEKPNSESSNVQNQNQEFESLAAEQTNQEETKLDAEETNTSETNSTPEKVAALEQETNLKEITEPFPSMMMMMNNHPGEIFQIPVQVIQNPIEEELTQNTAENAAVEAQVPARPISIDDIVELVKDKLDQAPGTEKTQETQNNLADNSEESLKMDAIPQEQTEQLIVPIYQRVSPKPNDNMITAHSKDDSPATSEELIVKPVSSENIPETEANVEPEAPTNLQNLETQSNIDRTQRARSIKTASKMDPRKRRFLFKSDAS